MSSPATKEDDDLGVMAIVALAVVIVAVVVGWMLYRAGHADGMDQERFTCIAGPAVSSQTSAEIDVTQARLLIATAKMQVTQGHLDRAQRLLYRADVAVARLPNQFPTGPDTAAAC